MMIVAVLCIAALGAAQSYGQTAQQNPPAAQGTQPAQGAQPAAGTTPAPQGKRQPMAKTDPEFAAFNTAKVMADPAQLEKAADDFATKFPDSELRVLLYKMATRAYQSAGNGEKMEAMGRKVLAIDGDDPESLVTVAEVIAEKTHDSDLDKDQRYAEAMKLADKATQTVDTDLAVPADKLEMAKGFIRSAAYSVMGTIEFKKENYPNAQTNLQKSIDAFPQQPDPVVVLRLAISLDKQGKYPDALKVANHAIEVAQSQQPQNANVITLAQRERDRLQQLTGGAAAPAPAANQPPKN